MRRFLMVQLLLVISLQVSAQEVKRKISGRVLSDGEPLKNVNIRVKNALTGVLTNARGKYSIQASTGDVLVFSYVGKQVIEVEVNGENNVFNLEMSPDVQKLHEVVVKKKRPSTQKELLAEYPFNSNLIKTNWGILDKDRASYSMQIVDGSEIFPVGPDFLTSLQSHFPNMRVDRDTLIPVVYLQNWSRSNSKDPPPSAIFDVDGIIYQQTPTFIIPDEIDRVAIMVRNGAMARYGAAGAGGVIIINTKEKTRVDELGVQRSYDNTDLMDSLYNKVTEKKSITAIVPDYVRGYKTVNSEKEAWQVFEDLKATHENSPSYFLDVSKYFGNKWGSREKSLEILADMEDRFSDDAMALRALAFRYGELGQKEKALEVYLNILNIESKQAQSHRDVANAYAEIGNYKRALNNYARYEHAVNKLDTVPYEKYGLDLLMTSEAHNILRVHGKEFAVENAAFQDDNLMEQNIRLLFEWNRPEADFELQIVSPDKYYDDWRTPGEGSFGRLRGYSSQQFFLDDDFTGEWQVNVKYLGNTTEEAPTYLKVTVFFDYGKPLQSKQSKVFKLQEKGVDLKLLSILTDEKHIRP